jgi:hypothetical protein
MLPPRETSDAMKKLNSLLLRYGIVMLLLLLGSSGCQDNPRGRKAVSGTVKLKGVPLNYGSIDFRPEPSSAGIATGTIIRDGKYEIPAKKGLPNGTYEVRINSTEADTSPPDPTMINTGGSKNAIERIPPEYNIRTTQKVVVSDDAEASFNFEIP